MRSLKSLFLLLAILVTAGPLSAQIKDPTTWTYNAKRKFGNHFEVFFHVKLSPTWHIYALNPGGDGSMIPPTFQFEANSKIKLLGKMKETTKPKEETIEGIEGNVRLFDGEVTFVQEIEVSGTAVVKASGTHQYQVCTDKMCLPPKTKSFTVRIKP